MRIIVGAALALGLLAPLAVPGETIARSLVGVVSVIDGDTLEMAG